MGKEAPIRDIQDNQDEDDTNKEVEDVNYETKKGTEEEIEEDTEEGIEEETENNHTSGVAPKEGAPPTGATIYDQELGSPYG